MQFKVGNKWGTVATIMVSITAMTSKPTTSLGFDAAVRPPSARHVSDQIVRISPTVIQSIEIWADAANNVHRLTSGINTSRFATQFTRFAKTMSERLAPIVTEWKLNYYPENLRSIPYIGIAQVFEVTSEGIALYAVPRTDIATMLVRASTGSERHRILTDHRQTIAKDCITALDSVTDTGIQEHVRFAREAATVLQLGYTHAAQSLATTTIDNLKGRVVAAGDSDLFPTKKNPNPLDDYGNLNARAALALSPLCAALSHYRSDQDTTIPTEYNRHATVHAASLQQHTESNAILAVLLVTSLLAYINDEKGQPQILRRKTIA